MGLPRSKGQERGCRDGAEEQGSWQAGAGRARRDGVSPNPRSNPQASISYIRMTRRLRSGAPLICSQPHPTESGQRDEGREGGGSVPYLGAGAAWLCDETSRNGD